jgi:hypothetical protein
VTTGDSMQEARRRMLAAQRDLMAYEQHLEENPANTRTFKRLYARVQVCTDEYLALVMAYLKQRYGEVESPSEEPPESISA